MIGVSDIVIIAAVAMVVGLAALFIVKEKKKGKRCIGCPDGGCAACMAKNDGGNCDGKNNDAR